MDNVLLFFDVVDLEDRFNAHASLCASSGHYDHFTFHGLRFVRCDRCHQILPVDYCLYYGGELDFMLLGGCRNCYGAQRPGANGTS